MSDLPKTLLFMDIEATGADAEDPRLLELAAILVRAHDLEQVSRFHCLVQCHAGVSDTRVWDPYVVEMHSKNHLLVEIAKSAKVDPGGAIRAFGAWLGKLGLPAKSCSFAGSSVHTDLRFLANLDVKMHGKAVIDWKKFSHRLLDMSSLRTFNRMAGTALFPEKKPDENHRAMGDCEQDLAQLKAARALQSSMVVWKTPTASADNKPLTLAEVLGDVAGQT